MIKLGEVQKLKIVRKTSVGVYLNEIETNDKSEDILLPKNQVTDEMNVGDEIEVFIYKDSEDRWISTTKRPYITLGQIGLLKAVNVTRYGSFLDWGLEKDLFLPFKEQSTLVKVGESYLVGIYIDRTDRLCATMNIYEMLKNDSTYKANQKVRGTVYKIHNELGAFVAVDNRYNALIPMKEIYGEISYGDIIEARIKRIRQDGKIELSLRESISNQIEVDAKIIMDKLESAGGKLLLNDGTPAELIKLKLNMSKSAFKRAIGKLYKERKIEITETGIKKVK